MWIASFFGELNKYIFIRRNRIFKHTTCRFSFQGTILWLGNVHRRARGLTKILEGFLNKIFFPIVYSNNPLTTHLGLKFVNNNAMHLSLGRSWFVNCESSTTILSQYHGCINMNYITSYHAFRIQTTGKCNSEFREHFHVTTNAWTT